MTGLKRKIRKWLYGRMPGVRGSMPYYGVKVYFPARSHIFEEACEQGVYEHQIVELLIRLVKPDSHFFDVGANIGLISIPILQAVETCRVTSFEPSPNTLPYLRRTVEESRFENRWAVAGKAAADYEGEIRFSVSYPELGAFDGILDTGRAGCAGQVVLPATTLDAEWRRLARPNVSAVKIDVEGSEMLVLKGARECIETCRPYILLEWNILNFGAYGFKRKDLLGFARQSGYRVFSVPHLIPIDDESALSLHMLKSENFLLSPSVE